MVSQIWNNFLIIVAVALVIEVGVSAVFSVKFLDDVLQSTVGKSVKNFLVLLIAFGFVYHFKQLGIFNGVRLGGVKIKWIHYIISALVLARMANLWHDLFKYLKVKAQQAS